MILAHPINYNFPLYFAFTSLSYRNEMYDNNNSQTKEARLKHTMITRHRLLQSSPLNKCLKLYYIMCSLTTLAYSYYSEGIFKASPGTKTLRCTEPILRIFPFFSKAFTKR